MAGWMAAASEKPNKQFSIQCDNTIGSGKQNPSLTNLFAIDVADLCTSRQGFQYSLAHFPYSIITFRVAPPSGK